MFLSGSSGLSWGRRRAPLVWCVVLVLAPASLVAFAGETRTAPTPGAADEQLFAGVRQHDPALLRSSLSAGANVNAKVGGGVAPLLQLFRNQEGPLSSEARQCLAILLEHGADSEARDENQRTALICAARLGDLASVEKIIEANAYAKARDRFHRTALMYAVEAGRRDIVLYLAQNGDLQSHTYSEKRAQEARKALK